MVAEIITQRAEELGGDELPGYVSSCDSGLQLQCQKADRLSKADDRPVMD